LHAYMHGWSWGVAGRGHGPPIHLKKIKNKQV
jgi:hypothetical protein